MSLPSRERGLKYDVTEDRPQGALLSLPSRERGLKLDDIAYRMLVKAVAPLAGAWIEIEGKGCACGTVAVAPLAGAWIEIVQLIHKSSTP